MAKNALIAQLESNPATRAMPSVAGRKQYLTFVGRIKGMAYDHY
jgi:hypothetical protein